MGGYGSTRWNGHYPKAIAERSLALDVRRLAREGALTSAHSVVAWTHGERRSTIMVRGAAESITLIYSTRRGPADAWTEVREPVAITRTPCHFGGERPWFVCLGCGRRVAVLYAPNAYFRCRRCHELTYASTREPEHERLLYKAQAIRTRLGGSGNIVASLPDKPKGMHWTTYRRLREREHEYHLGSIIGALRSFGCDTTDLTGAVWDEKRRA
jgi:hypothetical protein